MHRSIGGAGAMRCAGAGAGGAWCECDARAGAETARARARRRHCIFIRGAAPLKLTFRSIPGRYFYTFVYITFLPSAYQWMIETHRRGRLSRNTRDISGSPLPLRPRGGDATLLHTYDIYESRVTRFVLDRNNLKITLLLFL